MPTRRKRLLNLSTLPIECIGDNKLQCKLFRLVVLKYTDLLIPITNINLLKLIFLILRETLCLHYNGHKGHGCHGIEYIVLSYYTHLLVHKPEIHKNLPDDLNSQKTCIHLNQFLYFSRATTR